ncbi:MAG: amidohydrolase family protein [Bacteroidota bacterium]
MKRLHEYFLALIILVVGSGVVQAQITEKPEFGKFAIVGATLHTVTNGTIENGVLLIDGEDIVFVGKNAKITPDFTRIDASGKHVYPGLIDSRTSLGLVEIQAVDRTVDNREVGNFKAHVEAFTAINPNSASIPVTRVNGVTNVIAVPTGGRIAGMATLIDLWGYSPDSMAVLQHAGLHVQWPSALGFGRFDRRTEKQIKEQYENSVSELQDYWDEAAFYHTMWTEFEANSKGKTQPDIDRGMSAMRKVLTGEVPVILSVSREKDILNAIEWAKKQENVRFILNGVQEGWRVADEIAEAGLPVIVNTLYTPTRGYDNYQRPYQNPGLLQQAGVKVIIGTGETENVRNLPYHAGFAATYGLGVEEALKSVTIHAAEVWGVADQLGSLEQGKKATLFISDGDPFEPLSNFEQVFIKGYKIPMVSRHTQLFEQFLERDAVNK